MEIDIIFNWFVNLNLGWKIYIPCFIFNYVVIKIMRTIQDENSWNDVFNTLIVSCLGPLGSVLIIFFLTGRLIEETNLGNFFSRVLRKIL